MKSFFKITVFLFIIFTIGCSRSNENISPTAPGGNNDQNNQNQGSNSKDLESLRIQKFNDLVMKIRQFTQDIPDNLKSFFAGDAYNTFLQQAYDPFSSMTPIMDPPKPSQYFGIGAGVLPYRDDKVSGIIAIPFKGSPAQKAGLKKGDLIISVNDVEFDQIDKENMDVNLKILEDVVEKIKGPAGTQVKLKFIDFCDSQEKEVVITRGPITHSSNTLQDSYFVNTKQEERFKECPSQTSNVDQIGTDDTSLNGQEQKKSKTVSFEALYVPIKSFVSSSPEKLCQDFIKVQIRDLQNPLSIGMIIDLRGNSGGYLHEVTCMLNTLIPSDEIMVSQMPVNKGVLQKNSSSVVNIRFNKGGFLNFNESILSYNRNIIVLIDGNSASASEIFAGTIQEMKRGWVIGQRSFGKGTVQTSYPRQFNNGRRLRENITTGIYTLNSGRSPQGYGVIPDFLFSRSGEPIKMKDNYVSYANKVFFNNIQFENNVWEQNRSDELAVLEECVKREGRMNQVLLKENEQRNERHKQPFLADYHVELAKDILLCSGTRDHVLKWDFYGTIPESEANTHNLPQ